MVEFVFGPEDVARVRFAFSPNWELVSSVRALRRPSAHALHVPWAEDALRALLGFDISLLLALIPPEGYVPDFFCPPPDTPLPEFDDELAAARCRAPPRDAPRPGFGDDLPPGRRVPAHRVRPEIGRLYGRRPPAVLRP